MSHHDALRDLAREAGVADEYWDITRGETRHTSHGTREFMLSAMGFAVSSEGDARESLRAFIHALQSEMCDNVRVASRGEAGLFGLRLPSSSTVASFSLEILLESGHVLNASGIAELAAHRSDQRQPSHFLRTALDIPYGYHDASIRVEQDSQVLEGRQRLIVTPTTCPDPSQILGNRRGFGIAANLYTVRDELQGPIGDLGSIERIGEIALEIRDRMGRAADFVGINPLHTLRIRGGAVGPYSPVSRLFRNILYLNLHDIPEHIDSPWVQQRMCDQEFLNVLMDISRQSSVKYELVLDLIFPILRELHRVFRGQSSSGPESARARAYEDYCRRQGEVLNAFAEFEARAHFGASAPEDVDLFRYLQFELDRQLAEAQRILIQNGMRVGIYNDLALSSAGSGFDAWYFRDLFVQKVTLGAPPDAFAGDGQTWGIPPVSPLALRRSCYDYWTRLLRASFEHCGMLRIDHVMGLWRQFWVPNGGSPRDGAYVQYPANDLLSILALESSRAAPGTSVGADGGGALVVGEDLGTVHEQVRPELTRRRIMSSKVMYFERREHGRFAPPEHFPPLSLASCNTHDLPTLVQWWMAAERWEKEFLLDELRGRGLLSEADCAGLLDIPWDGTRGGSDPRMSRLVEGVHRFLCAGSSLLVSLALDDLALETESVNKPGVPMEEHASWSRRMSVSLDELPLTSTSDN